jgi:quercetin dioxygenase-like cupin family protein
MSGSLTLTPHESIQIKRSTPEVLEVEATYSPGGKKPPSHIHPAQDEHFEVLSGRVEVVAGDEERVVGPGETIDFPRGTPHRMGAAGDEPARVRWQTTPAGRTEDWFRAIDALYRQGRVARDGMPGPLAYGVMLTEYRDVFRLAAGPEPITRGAMAALGAVGRLRGYSAKAA